MVDRKVKFMIGYPDFISSTGFGRIRGLAGINCRHSVHPIDPAVDKPIYTKETLNKLNTKRVKMPNGKTIPLYNATQEQRRLERKIRAAKREKAAVLAINAPTALVQLRISGLQRQMRVLCEKTGLPRQYDREQI